MNVSIANQGVKIVNRERVTGLVLMRTPVRRVESASVVREATTGRVVLTVPGAVARPRPILLPKVWAVAEVNGAGPDATPKLGLGATKLLLLRARDARPSDVLNANRDEGTVVDRKGNDGPILIPNHEDRLVVDGVGIADHASEDDAAVNGLAFAEIKVQLAFYRRYTEAMLRRYLRLSMAAGRVPSLLGRELFRGHVTSYKVRSFEDVVIFCFDMEKLLGRLRPTDQQMIKRIVLQEYSQGETASMLRMSLRSCQQGYGKAVDRLTGMLLETGMLEPLESCQVVPHPVMEVSSSLQVR
jgi:hypothetical protein